MAGTRTAGSATSRAHSGSRALWAVLRRAMGARRHPPAARAASAARMGADAAARAVRAVARTRSEAVGGTCRRPRMQPAASVAVPERPVVALQLVAAAAAAVAGARTPGRLREGMMACRLQTMVPPCRHSMRQRRRALSCARRWSRRMRHGFRRQFCVPRVSASSVRRRTAGRKWRRLAPHRSHHREACAAACVVIADSQPPRRFEIGRAACVLTVDITRDGGVSDGVSGGVETAARGARLSVSPSRMQPGSSQCRERTWQLAWPDLSSLGRPS